MNNINWSIGLEVTLSVLGFTDINTPTRSMTSAANGWCPAC